MRSTLLLGVVGLLCLVAGAAQALSMSDAFGHELKDDSVALGPEAQWDSIASTGTMLSLTNDGQQAIALPFSFQFYGTSYTTLYVHANGLVAFTDAGGAHPGPPRLTAFPNEEYPHHMIGGVWDDLDPDGGAVYHKTIGTSPYRTFVVEFHDVPHEHVTAAKVRFQVRLLETFDVIELQMDDVDSTPPWVTGDAAKGTTEARSALGIQDAGMDGLNVENGNWGKSKDAYQIRPPGTEPAGVSDAFVVDEDHVLTGDVFANDHLIGSTREEALLRTGPSDGTLTLSSDGTFTYTPDADFFGTDTFEYGIKDAWNTGGHSTTYSVAIDVLEVNDAPSIITMGDVTVDEDHGTKTVTGWATSISPGPPNEALQTLTTTIVADKPALFSTRPALDASGTLRFTSAANACGTTDVTLELKDDGGTLRGGVDTHTERFSITLTCINDPPTTFDDVFTMDEDAPSAAYVLTANDLEAPDSGETLLITAIEASTLGTVTLGPGAGEVTFVPDPHAHGTETLEYTLSDTNGTLPGIEKGHVTFTVRAVNDAPTLTDGGDQAVDEDAGPQTVLAWSAPLMAGPAHESGQELTTTVDHDRPGLFVVPPALDAAGTLTYTPADHACGTATVTVTSQDDGGTAHGGTDRVVVTFRIDVACVNDAPTITLDGDQAVLWDAGPTAIAGFAGAASAGPAAESSQNVDLAITTDKPGLFETVPALDPSGTLTFDPAPGTDDLATVTVTVQDDGGTAHGGTDTTVKTFTIHVQDPNQPPVAADDAFAVLERVHDAPLAVLDGDVDADGDLLRVLSVTAPMAAGSTVGTTTMDGAVVRFTPDAAFEGMATFTYTVGDGRGGTDTGTVVVEVADPATPLLRVVPEEACRGQAWRLLVHAHYQGHTVVSWRSGDASASDGTHLSWTPTLVFDEVGIHTVAVEAVFDDGATAALDLEVDVLRCSVPTAAFSLSLAGREVAFADDSHDADGDVVHWSWDFGDGHSSTLRSPMHSYASTGNYLVSLTVTDDDGRSGSAVRSVAVGGSGGRSTGAMDGATGTISGEQGTGGHADGPAKDAPTDRGGGRNGAGADRPGPGGGAGHGRGADTSGEGDTGSQVDGLMLEVVASPGGGHAFDAQVPSGARVVFWDFGDGSTSTEARPRHAYEGPGQYVVRAEVLMPGGERSTAVQFLTVDADPEDAERTDRLREVGENAQVPREPVARVPLAGGLLLLAGGVVAVALLGVVLLMWRRA